MKCVEASEITAYLQGEGSEEDRAMLRSHYEQCESCARDLAASERAFSSLGGLRPIEPSPDFQRRTEEAFLAANPRLQRRRFGLLPRLAAAAALLVAAGAAVALLRPVEPGPRLGHVEPAPVRDEDPEYMFTPKNEPPAAIDERAWGEASAVDRRLVAAVEAPRAWEKEMTSALAWLAARQESDGSWKGTDSGETIELTGLAVLALNGTNEAAAKKGVEFLISRQRDSGAVGGGSPESHGIATLALLEASIRAKNPDWAKAAAKGVELIAQQNRDGPWGRGPVAGWHYHVLRLAVAAGDRSLVPVLLNGANARGAGLWTDPKPDVWRWKCRVADFLVRSPIPGTAPANFGKNDLRLAYFGTTLLRPLEGDAWTKWWSPLRAKLLKAQGPDGSWPEGFEPGKGKVYATALATLILQTPVRIPALGD